MPDGIRRRTTMAGDTDPDLQGVHPVLARVLCGRGIRHHSEISYPLNALLAPGELKGVGEAGSLLADMLAADEPVLLIGDYDADGATSTALAVHTLRAMGAAQADFLVPNRFEYGYGLTPEIVELAATQQPALIVTVDNGISSIEGVSRARELGIRVIVTDHHLPGEQLPDADVIVNPSQPGCQFPSKALAGVGVIFYVMLALRGELRRRDWFQNRGMTEPNVAEVLDLVALGTVADVVPLDYNNRILVQQGLLRIRAGKARPGIRALLELAGRDSGRLVAADLAFAIGPRLNAAGRLDDMSLGINCLLSGDLHQARQLATQLDTLNRDRQQIEKGMQEEALAIIRRQRYEEAGEKPVALCLYEPEWHEGVVGILASRIKDRLHRPVIAFARSANGQLKGSARSIPGLHIRDVLERVATLSPGLIDKFGGHAMAAGLSLEEHALEEFQQRLITVTTDWLDGVALEAVVESDGELAGADFELELARELRYAGPWGQHFPEPLFDGEFELLQQRLVGERHLKLVLAHPLDDADMLDAIAFNVDLQHWPDQSVSRVKLAYRLDCNYFRGRESLQLLVEHIEAC